jgi:REP element-mobilizing transposase RayT
MARHVYNLRSRRAFSVIGPAIAAAADRFGVRIIEFSVQGNHIHLVVEAAAHEALARAMQGFLIRVAKGLNRMMSRTGRVLADRYYAHLLETPTEARWAVSYVRRNYHKHMAQLGKPVSDRYVDPFASTGADVELAVPRTWALRCAAGPP